MRPSSSFNLATTPLDPGVTLLEASAGTGKTFTIAGLFLRLLLERGLTVEQILVVTFTDAATAELRGRIRKLLAAALRTLRTGEPPNPPVLAELLAGTEAERSVHRANLEAALEQFDAAAVFTIHGFCQRVLQERAFESRALFDAELTPDATPFLRETADNFWRRNFYEAPARHVLFAQHAGLTAEELFGLLRTHAQHAQVTVLARATDRPWPEVLAEVDAAFDAAAAIWRAERTAITAHFGAACAWGNRPYNHDGEMAARFAALEALLNSDAPGADGLACVADFTPAALAAKRAKKAKVPNPEHPFFTACDQLATALEIFGARLRYKFLTTSAAELARLKDRDRKFGFDDLLSRVADTLAGPAGPVLATALRHRYRAALIDEFQDTDPVQWDIFERVFAGGEPRPHLYLVGDPKQAIYSFRGADVFAYLRARMRADREFTLGENWRSERRLVAAVNTLFGRNPCPFALAEIKFQPVTPRGAADDTPLTEAGKRLPPLRVWFWDATAAGVTRQEAQKTRLAEAVADEVVRLLNGDVYLGPKRLTPGEIAVLVDNHREAEIVARALARRRIPAVRRTQQSVFGTRAAEELQALLEALAPGARDGQRRAALATSLVGVDAAALAACRANDAGWEAWLDRLARWSGHWEHAGFLPMFECVLREQQTRGRLLALAEGERQLTNFLHLGELVQHAAAGERLSARGLVTWLAEQRGRAGDGAAASKDALLRLERDAAAVQLVTLHSSKGIEYPVVFCPFLTRKPDRKNAAVLFHDPADQRALKQDVGSSEQAANQRRTTGETFAENLRLLYVALTRAQHRCYVAWGQLNDSETAALAWLIHAPPGADQFALEDSPEGLAKHVDALEAGPRRADVEALAGDEIEVCDLPPLTTNCWQPTEADGTPGTAREFRGAIRRDRGMASFSSLAHGRAQETLDRDAVATAVEGPMPPPTVVSNPLAGFRGTRAGTCLHEVFEQLDFTTADPVTLRARVDEKLRCHGFSAPELGGELTALIGRVLDAELMPGLRLRTIPLAACWHELEFLLPLNRLTPDALRAAFAAVPRGDRWAEFAASLGRLNFADIEGFVGGFMDLVFRHDGRWWLADWKSNWLGDSLDDYGPDALWNELLGQQYPLQYHLYLLALHRLLRARLPDYDYERDVGGALYVFVRGVTPGRTELGVFHDRPPLAVIEELERRLLGAPAPTEVGS